MFSPHSALPSLLQCEAEALLLTVPQHVLYVPHNLQEWASTHAAPRCFNTTFPWNLTTLFDYNEHNKSLCRHSFFLTNISVSAALTLFASI